MLLLVDAANLMYRAWHTRAPLTRSDGQPVGMIYNALKMLSALTRRERPTATIFAMEGGHQHRVALDPGYKAHRAEGGGRARADMAGEVAGFERLCACFGEVVSADGHEADDVIATYVRQWSNSGGDSLIYSNDKDLLCLVRPGVRVRAGSVEYETAADVERVWGVPPEKIPDVLALMGDDVDGIPGLPGIGRKRGVDVIRQRGSLEAALADPCGPPSVRKSLAAHGERARLNRRLIELRADIPLPAITERASMHADDLSAFCDEFEFRSFLERMAHG